jgi:hypothetical protein
MNARRRRQRGQAVVEMAVVIAVFGVFLLGLLQLVLFYRAKSLVDYAALQAARSGSVHGARMSAMKTGLARGLMPLYAHSPDAAGAAEAYAQALAAANNPLTAEIEVVSPTRAAFADWKERQYDGVQAIPNDSLAFRPATPGSRSGLSVQDANVLKIRVVYGYKMIVPVVDKIVIASLRLTGGLGARERLMLESGRLPIVAQAVVRMQSPIRDSGSLP